MRIIVDADACPVKEIIVEEARKRNIEVIMLIDTSHELNDGYSTVITVDKAKDSVDIKLINIVKEADLVVTQDFGVATMALGKGLKALNQNGLVYTNENIDRLLFERFLSQKARRAGKKTGNPPKRTKEDDERFREKLISLIEN